MTVIKQNIFNGMYIHRRIRHIRAQQEQQLQQKKWEPNIYTESSKVGHICFDCFTTDTHIDIFCAHQDMDNVHSACVYTKTSKKKCVQKFYGNHCNGQQGLTSNHGKNSLPLDPSL